MTAVFCCLGGLLLGGCVAQPLPVPVVHHAACAIGNHSYVESTARTQRSLMVLANDQESQSVRRDLALVDRAGQSLAGELAAPNRRLFDRAVLASRIAIAPRTGEAELLSLAVSSSREPLDQVVLYSVFADTFPADDTFYARLRVAARVHAVPDGSVAGGPYEATDKVALNLPASCDVDCFTALVGDALRPLAAQVGRAIAQDIAQHGQSYPLELYGFSASERRAVEQQLRDLPGYQSHRVEEDTPDYLRLRYASTLLPTDLGYNLRTLTECLAIPSRVEYSADRYALRRQHG